MARRIAADAGPLIALACTGHLRALRRVLGNILVPDVVATECLREPSRPGAHAIRQAFKDGVLVRKRVYRSPLFHELLGVLGPGEAAAIALARSLSIPVLLDEKYARRAARRLGIAVIGTGGFLIRAKRSGTVSQVKPVLDQLRHANYRFSEALLTEILRQCGER